MLHYENLQPYLRLGLKLTKIHSILEFNQSQWLKPHVKFTTQERIEPKQNGEKDRKMLCKLLKNAVYGKTMEKLRNTIDVKLVTKKTVKMEIKTKLYVQKII